MSKALVEYKNVTVKQEELTVLKEVSFSIFPGDFIYLCGKVGSGKSSLMKTMYAETPVTDGYARVMDYEIKTIRRKDIPLLRRRIGIVFQDFKLLHDRTVNQNLEFVLKATGWKDKTKIKEQIELVLSTVDLSKKGYKRPHQLSGGEQQRVVIARALLNSPELILADEPTGNLDPETAQELVALLRAISEGGTAVIITTHNVGLAELIPGKRWYCGDEQLTCK